MVSLRTLPGARTFLKKNSSSGVGVFLKKVTFERYNIYVISKTTIKTLLNLGQKTIVGGVSLQKECLQ